jgi:hypothetical protein
LSSKTFIASRRYPARSSIERCGHGPVSSAARAAATPLSNSRKLGTTTRPNSFSVLGLTTSSHCLLEPINHSPPTNSSSMINTASSPSSGWVMGPV